MVNTAIQWPIICCLDFDRDTCDNLGMAKTNKALSAKKLDAFIESIYYKNCSGIEINIMDIGKVFAAGRVAYAEAFANGAGTEIPFFVTRAVVDFVNTIRKN